MAVLKKHQRQTYAVIDHSALRDTGLSWRATGLLAYLLSLPDDWRVNIADLTNRKTDGRTSTASGMSELEEAGYVVRRKLRDDNGTFHTTVHVAESPEMLLEITDQPTLGLPTSVDPTVGDPDTKKELEEVSSNEVSRNHLAPKAARDEVWDTLSERFGEPSTTSAKSLWGKLVKSLAAAGATREEMHRRMEAWPFHFPDAVLTETALEKHWDRLGRPPVKASREQVDEYQTELRRLQRQRRAEELDAAERGLPG